jgi:hypothetical protein
VTTQEVTPAVLGVVDPEVVQVFAGVSTGLAAVTVYVISGA